MGDLYQFTYYEGYKDEYITFCTPECAKAIDAYLDYRERSGEIITEESYIIRQEFDSNDLEQVKRNSKPLAKSTVRGVMLHLLLEAGVRTQEKGADTSHRKEVKELHGFRKFFTSQLVNANINTEKRWLLEGHALSNNDPAYVRVKDQLYSEYMKAVDFLTINEESKLKKRVETLTEEKNEVTMMELRHKNDMQLVLEQLGYLNQIKKMDEEAIKRLPNLEEYPQELVKWFQDEVKRKKNEASIAELAFLGKIPNLRGILDKIQPPIKTNKEI
jgi:hypothetical protein